MEVGPLRPGAEGPPPLPASLRRSQGVPTSLGSLALSLSRLGYHVAPHSTLWSIQSRARRLWPSEVWATWADSKARCGAVVWLETTSRRRHKQKLIKAPSPARPPGSHSRGAPGSGRKQSNNPDRGCDQAWARHGHRTLDCFLASLDLN